MKQTKLHNIFCIRDRFIFDSHDFDKMVRSYGLYTSAMFCGTGSYNNASWSDKRKSQP